MRCFIEWMRFYASKKRNNGNIFRYPPYPYPYNSWREPQWLEWPQWRSSPGQWHRPILQKWPQDHEEILGEKKKLTWTSTDNKVQSNHIDIINLLVFWEICHNLFPTHSTTSTSMELQRQIVPKGRPQRRTWRHQQPEALHWVLQCLLQRTRNWENQVANHLACLACAGAPAPMMWWKCAEMNIISTNTSIFLLGMDWWLMYCL